jgi:hypothetical protein
MRGEQREGRFDIMSERASIIKGTTVELVRTVGNTVEWWIYDAEGSHIDHIYDVGSSMPNSGGRRWMGPLILPVINSTLTQGATMQNDRGFYNTDVLSLTINMDIIEKGTDLVGSNAATMPHFQDLPDNPDEFLRDRIVFKGEVFSPIKMKPMGILTNQYTVWGVDCAQVNAEEMVNDIQFQKYAGYIAFADNVLSTVDEDPIVPITTPVNNQRSELNP